MSAGRENTRWLERGAWAVADQGMFALANVALNVVLGRWLTSDQYGAFAVGYSLFLLIGALHTALLTEPLLVFGPGKYARQRRAYLGLLLRGHWALTGIGSLLLIIAGLVLTLNGVGPLARTVFVLALATPFSLLMWFARRAAYLTVQPRLAAAASTLHLALLLTGLLVLADLHLVSIFSALAAVGVAGAVTGSWLLRRVFRAIQDEDNAELPTFIVDHWRYGRWASSTSILTWVPLNLFFVVLSVLVNFEASATLKALSSLVLPLLQTNAALASLLLPALVVRARQHGRFRQLVRSSLALFAGVACVYALGIAAFGQVLVHLLYGGKYDPQVNVLWLLLLIPLLDGALVVTASALRSLERPDLVFWAQLAVASFVFTAGLLLTRLFGLWGAASGMVLADLLGAVILAITLLAYLRRRDVRQTSACREWPRESVVRPSQPTDEVCRTFS